MMERELSAFLAMVRRTSFVEYLQPAGETAQSAFERRLSWARAHRHDPAHIDEASFLLDNADSLREIVLAEVEESDWVEEASVGREFDTRQPGRATSRPSDRYTSMDDDLDEGSAAYPTEVQSRNGRRGQPSVTPATTIGRGTQPSRLPAHPSADFPYAPNGRPQDARAPNGGRPGGGARSVAPDPQRVTVRPGPGRVSQGTPQPGRGGGAGVGALRRSPGETTPMARNPEPARGAPRAQSRPPTPEERRPDDRRGRSAPSMAPQSDLPRPARGGGRAGFTPRSVAPSIPPFDRRGNLPPMSSGERTAAMAAPVEDLPSGIMPLEDFSGYQPHTFPAASGSADETVALPYSAIREAEARDVRQPPPPIGGYVEPAPSARLRRATSNSEASPPRVRSTTPPGASRSSRPRTASAPYPEYPELGARPRSRWFGRLVRATLVLMLLGGLAGGAVVGYPYLRDSGLVERAQVFVTEGGDALLRQLEQAGDPGPAVSEPASPGEPAAAEAPKVAAQEPAEAPAPAAEPEDARAVASIASAARATEEPERPKATPASTDTARAASTPRKAEATPAPSAETRSSAPAVDVQGLWVGSTMTGLSFKLTVLEQKGAAFEGTVEVQKEDSTFDSLSITGTVDSAGSMSFKGGGATFAGTITSDRRRAVGTYKVSGGETVKWYAVH